MRGDLPGSGSSMFLLGFVVIYMYFHIMEPMDASLAELLRTAEHQHGVVISRQARECGISSRHMNGLVEAGGFRMLRSRAFAVAGRPPSPWEDAVAVLLLGGRGAVLSHGTAAAIHRLPGLIAPDLPELTVAAPRHPRVPAATLGRSSAGPARGWPSRCR